ncbi:MAG: arginine--tRNA ligase [Chitinophagales bacterium]|nr:arginine--tRNA ligase [Chitinophagales bacterium]
MDFLVNIREAVGSAIKTLYDIDLSSDQIVLNETRKEFSGDYTYVVFPLVKQLKKKPTDIGDEIGQWLIENRTQIAAYETVQGFLNLTLVDDFWFKSLIDIGHADHYGYSSPMHKKVLVEFASPNTNKPLHLGHIRNILLGWSCSKILKANGYEVVNTQIINDRGIAICKSMLAWKKFGNGATPESTCIKGDHFVGDYYVAFEKAFVAEYEDFQQRDEGEAVYHASGSTETKEAFFKKYKNQYFNEHSALGAEARQMLMLWEQGDAETLALWKQMNQWVYDGFDVTFDKLGVTFDSTYYESDTYLLGKKVIEMGLDRGVFYKKEDGSVWIDLEDVGMDQKLLLRSDGTSVYMTQDIGTAQQRFEDYGMDKMVYTVGDEQDYHFKVLFEIMKRLGESYAEGLYHLSYGMVELPEGRMKSREGTVVDADDIVAEVIEEARLLSAERGEIESLPKSEQDDILRKIGLAALKFFIVKVQPKKKMIFDPKESVDMQGQTGPYIQNAYVRIQSVKRKMAVGLNLDWNGYNTLNEYEKILVKHIMNFPDIVKEAGEQLDPSTIANYTYVVAKDYHRFYHEVRILNAESEAAKSFRVVLSDTIGYVLLHAFDMLGIEMPERM